MLNISDILKNKELIKKKMSYIGSYSILSNKIKLKFEEPFNYNIPYNLTDKEFQKNHLQIKKAITNYHESTHFVQAWTTTTGIIEFLFQLGQIHQISNILQRTKFKLPLDDFFNKCLKESDSDNSNFDFVSLLLGKKYQEFNSLWLLGLIPYEQINIEKEEDIILKSEFFSNVKINFINEEIDKGFQMNKKNYELLNLLSPQKIHKKAGHTIATSFGALHLQECFAKTVEIENLLWFNNKQGEQYIRSWMNDDEAILYNAAFRLYIHVVSPQKKTIALIIFMHT